MRKNRERRSSSLAGRASVAPFGVILLAFSGSVAMAQQASKTPAKAPAAKAGGGEEVMFPHMDQALAYLQAAAKQLQQAEPWFGGHREKAMGHVNAAIGSVEKGINEYMAKHPSAVRNKINPDTISVPEGHHFGTAMKLTKQAQAELAQAKPIFYGEREPAEREVNAALEEMNAGAAYYRAHGPPKR